MVIKLGSNIIGQKTQSFKGGAVWTIGASEEGSNSRAKRIS